MISRASVLLLAAGAAGQITYDEARCIMEGKTMAFFGDSITRYCTMFFNYWLEEGELQPGDFFEYDGEEWGLYDQDREDCCDSRPTWTDYAPASSNEQHRQLFVKDDFGDAFEDQPRTEFRFLQKCYFDDDESDGEPSVESISEEIKDYDFIVFNCGWWNLRDDDDGYCGLDWDDDCRERYDDQWDSLDETLFSGDATLIYRGSTCCGDGDADGEWAPAIQDQNEQAKERIEQSGGTYVDVFDLFDYDDILAQTDTFDDTHPSKENCLTINLMVLQAIDAANGSPCTSGAGNAPTYQPTEAQAPPTTTATIAPTPQATVADTAEASPGQTAEASPRGNCTDDAEWYKKDEPDKSCAWVAEFSPTRCAVRGFDDKLAFQSCRESCGTCFEEPCSNEDSPTWFMIGQPEKDCAWVADAYLSRCSRFSEDGVYAFEACPYACRTCGFSDCEDSSTWTVESDTSKDCDWVGEASSLRCSKHGADTNASAMAFVSCPQACQVCSGDLGDGCEDDADWHKKGDASKNCSWVAEFFPRCNAKGQDDTWAYEMCRVACATC